MALGKYTPINFNSYESKQMQARVKEVLDRLTSLTILDGQLLTDIELTTGANSVNHKLGRKILGYIVTAKSADESVYDNISTSASTLATAIELTVSGDVTVNLWVF